MLSRDRKFKYRIQETEKLFMFYHPLEFIYWKIESKIILRSCSAWTSNLKDLNCSWENVLLYHKSSITSHMYEAHTHTHACIYTVSLFLCYCWWCDSPVTGIICMSHCGAHVLVVVLAGVCASVAILPHSAVVFTNGCTLSVCLHSFSCWSYYLVVLIHIAVVWWGLLQCSHTCLLEAIIPDCSVCISFICSTQ